MSAIRLDDVRVRLGGAAVLQGITARVPAGKITGLLGPSGAGKTTLMRVIVGRQRVHGGAAEVLGRPAGSADLRGRIGYMTQSASVYPDLTARENMYYFAAMLGRSRQDANDALAQVDLSPQARQLTRTLSGGQRSRVSLAVALLGHPSLLVLDEPTVGVDPVLRQRLWEIFRGLAAAGTTLLVSSHVMDEASRCDELLLVRDGALLASGTPERLCERTGTASVEETFLKLVGAAA